LLATDLVDYLVQKGVPFREAHHLVGRLVRLAETSGKPLNELTVTDFQSVDKRFGGDALKRLDLKAAMAKRNLPGAPGTGELRKQILRWKRQVAR
jgi:argininosuccinate lyase